MRTPKRAWRRRPRGAGRPRALLTLAGVAVVAATVAGCGPATGGVSAVVGAARTTLGQWATSSSTFTSGEAFGAAVRPVQAVGAFAFAQGLGYERVELPSGRAGGPLFLDFVPTIAYINSLRGVPLPAGKSWIVASLAGPASSRFPRFAAQLEGLNPELVLDEIVWGATAITARRSTVGLNDVPTPNHTPYSLYVVSVSLSRARAAATGPSAAAMRRAIGDELAALPRSGGRATSTVHVTVWVDGPGRVAQLQAAIPGAGLGTVTVTLSNFGGKFPVSLPPTAQTVDIESLLHAFSSPWPLAGGA